MVTIPQIRGTDYRKGVYQHSTQVTAKSIWKINVSHFCDVSVELFDAGLLLWTYDLGLMWYVRVFAFLSCLNVKC